VWLGYWGVAVGIGLHWLALTFSLGSPVSQLRPGQEHLAYLTHLLLFSIPASFGALALVAGRALCCGRRNGEAMRPPALAALACLLLAIGSAIWYLQLLLDPQRVTLSWLPGVTALLILAACLSEGAFLWFVRRLGLVLGIPGLPRRAGWCGVLLGSLLTVALLVFLLSDVGGLLPFSIDPWRTREAPDQFVASALASIRVQLTLMARMGEFMAFVVLLKHADLARVARRGLQDWLRLRQVARLPS
jgi:hypothetical protein